MRARKPITLGATNRLTELAPADTLALSGGLLDDPALLLQASAANGTQAYYAVNKNGGYGLLVGYDAISNAAQVRQVAADPLNFYVNSTTLALSLTPDGNASFPGTVAAPLVQFPSTVGAKLNLFGSAYGIGVQAAELSLYSAGAWAFRQNGLSGTIVASLSNAGALTLGAPLAVSQGGTGATTAAGALSTLGAYPSSNPSGYIAASGAPVQSVAGRTGAVTLAVADVSGAYASSNPAGYQTASNVSTALAPYALTTSLPPASNATPLVNGTGAPGTSGSFAREGHVHPTDTSRYAASNPAGYVTSAGAPVQSVAGRTGAVTLAVADVSGAAPTASPSFTGTATAGTLLLSQLGAVGAVGGTQWQNQGGYLGWNLTGGGGETDFVNSRGGGGGGFNWYNVASVANAVPALVMSVNGAGALVLSTPLSVASGGTGATAAPAALANLGGFPAAGGGITGTVNIGTGSANFVYLNGAPANTGPVIGAAGSDANISLVLAAKGSGTIYVGNPLQLTTALSVANGGTGATTPAGARTGLGLGGAATLNVGTTAGTVAAGDDGRITGALSASTAASTYAPIYNPAFAGQTFSFGIASTASTVGFEIGSLSTPSYVYTDWHSSGTNNDYDVRLGSTGGSATAGQGTFAVNAGQFLFNGAAVLNAGQAVTVAQGGTGATTAAGALSNLGALSASSAAATYAPIANPAITGTLSVAATRINDGNVPIQINAPAGGTAYIGANKSGGYGLLVGYDQTFGGAVVRQVTADPLIIMVNGTTAALTITSNTTAAFTGTVSAPDLNVAGSGTLAGAWTSYTATVTAGSGTVGTSSATVRYKKMGRTVWFNLAATVAAGSGGGAVNVSLPFANGTAPAMLVSRDLTSINLVSGFMAAGSTSLSINSTATGGYPVPMGGSAQFAFSGTYEASA